MLLLQPTMSEKGMASQEDWPMNDILLDGQNRAEALKKINEQSYFQLLQGRIEMATRGSACFDLFATESVCFEPGQTIAIATGVVSKFSSDLRAIIKERSGLALNKDFEVHGGVIDSDYSLEWKVIAKWVPRYTWADRRFEVIAGSKIAQFKLEVIPLIALIGEGIVVLDAERTGGFGSTDLHGAS